MTLETGKNNTNRAKTYKLPTVDNNLDNIPKMQ